MSPTIRRPRLLAREVAEEGRRRGRFEVLLAAIVAAFAVEGIGAPNSWEQVFVTALLGITLVVAALTADARPRIVAGLTTLAVVLCTASLLGALDGHSEGVAARIANVLLVTLAPPLVVVGVLRSLRSKQQVTLEAVFGVLCLYILLGMFFAFVYALVQTASGTPFFAQGGPTNASRFLYFSFTTLTTVGYGDNTAATNLGHTLAMFEALFGQIYLVTVVALIVSNLGLSRRGSG